MSTRVSEAAAAMRKAPRQARSRATVDVIVTAGARVLDRHGWAGFTTNEVAQVAGVPLTAVRRAAMLAGSTVAAAGAAFAGEEALAWPEQQLTVLPMQQEPEREAL